MSTFCRNMHMKLRCLFVCLLLSQAANISCILMMSEEAVTRYQRNIDKNKVYRNYILIIIYMPPFSIRLIESSSMTKYAIMRSLS